jgi:hypothetical protein
MSHLFSTAGSRIYIGAAKAFNGVDMVAADFTTGTPVWTEIGGTTDLGSMGDKAELITSTQVAAARVRKLKGARNAGSTQIIADFDPADPGQLALIAAEKTQVSYAFKMVLTDSPAGGTPSARYFVALVMDVSEAFSEANNVMKQTSTLEIDSNIVRVDADEA